MTTKLDRVTLFGGAICMVLCSLIAGSVSYVVGGLLLMWIGLSVREEDDDETGN